MTKQLISPREIREIADGPLGSPWMRLAADEIERLQRLFGEAIEILRDLGDHANADAFEKAIGERVAAEPRELQPIPDGTRDGDGIWHGGLWHPDPPHTTEEDFQHFLSYSGKRGVPHEADLRLAYYAGADAPPPVKSSAEPRKNPADFPGGPLEHPEDFDPQ